MGLSLVTAPTTEPITLAEARAELNINDSLHDGVLVGQIFAAREWAEGETQKALMTQTWDFTLDYGWPLCDIELPKAPVQSVTSVTYVDEAGNSQTLSAGLYVLHKNRPVPVIARAYQATWPNVRWQLAAITVRMVCGYGSNPGDVPEDLRQAMLKHIQLQFDTDPTSRETIERIRDSLLGGNRLMRF